jgi:hypothetical protein
MSFAQRKTPSLAVFMSYGDPPLLLCTTNLEPWLDYASNGGEDLLEFDGEGGTAGG